MKSSAWYNMLWRKKLDDLPVKQGPDLSWDHMKGLLDQHLPVKTGSLKPAKSIGAKIVTFFAYVVPAAAMIGGVTYYGVQKTQLIQQKKHKAKKSQVVVVRDTITLPPDSLRRSGTDSLALKAADPSDNAGKMAMPFSVIAKASFVHPQQSKIDPSLIQPDAAFEQVRHKLLSVTPRVIDTPRPTKEPAADTEKSQSDIVVMSSDTPGIVLNTDGRDGTPSYITPNSVPGNAITDRRILKKITQHNTDGSNKNIKGGSTGSSKISVKRSSQRQLSVTGLFYGVEAGMNISPDGKAPFAGIYGGHPLNSKWLLETGVRYDAGRVVSGAHSHRSFNSIDSSSFKVYNTRKITTLVIPLNLAYRVSGRITINAGAHINYLLSQTDIKSKLGPISNYRDTLAKSQSIDSAFRHNSINKLTVGAAAGVSLNFGRFNIDGRYLKSITPYKVNTGLGTYNKYYGAFQIGIRYRLK